MKLFEQAIVDAGGEPWHVGGAVRDQLLGATDATDFDYVVTGLPLDRLADLLRGLGVVDLPGRGAGALKFRPEGRDSVFDLALPGATPWTGRAGAAPDPALPIEADLASRDFTMNAVAIRARDGRVIDPHGGQEDLRRRLVRVVAPGVFAEDPVRMLRAVQFAARLGFHVHPDTMAAMRAHAGGAASIPGPRVFEEIRAILVRAEYPSTAFRLMRDGGLLGPVFPELARTVGVTQPKKYHDLDVFTHILRTVDGVPSVKLHVRLAALFHDIAKPQTRSETRGPDGVPEIHFFRHEFEAGPIVNAVMRRWGAPPDLVRQVKRLVSCHMFPGGWDMTDRALRALLQRVGPELIHDLIDLRVGDRIASGKPFLGMGKIGHLRALIERELAEPAFSLKDLALDGNDLLALGMKPGPKFAEVLRALLERVLQDRSLNTKERLLALARELFPGVIPDGVPQA